MNGTCAEIRYDICLLNCGKVMHIQSTTKIFVKKCNIFKMIWVLLLPVVVCMKQNPFLLKTDTLLLGRKISQLCSDIKIHESMHKSPRTVCDTSKHVNFYDE
jgi:hypothetical protein